jgi:phosphofructokinase-like protein
MGTNGIKRIGVLTGGGDCPGLNAVIRVVTKAAMFDHGWEVFGIEDGYLGLIENRIRQLSADDVSGILTTGGTILGTSNKANPARYAIGTNDDGTPRFEDVRELCVKHAKDRGIDAVVCIGGDGTMSGASQLVEKGLTCVGVPKTIDNDLVGTDITFGFLSAVDIATEALDRIHTTAASHSRVMFVEVMGRNAGWISLYSGVAAGADIILIPEIPFSLDSIVKYIEYRKTIGRDYTVVCVSEGAKQIGGEQTVWKVDPTSPDPIRLGGVAEKLADDLERHAGLECRASILGHVQRGGSPAAADRILATEFGHHAVKLLATGATNRLVVRQGARVTDIDLHTAADKQRTVPMDDALLLAARSVGTCFGDG